MYFYFFHIFVAPIALFASSMQCYVKLKSFASLLQRLRHLHVFSQHRHLRSPNRLVLAFSKIKIWVDLPSSHFLSRL